MLDAGFVQFAPTSTEDGELLYKFISSASKLGCSPIPICDLSISPEREAALRRHWLESNCGLAVRVGLSDLAKPEFALTVQKLLLRLVAKPSDVILIFDLAGADFDEDGEEFARSVLVWLSQLQEIGLWRRTIVSWSSYPNKNPAPENGQAKAARKEWSIWKLLSGLDMRVRDLALFGDFGADNSLIRFEGGGLPITHLRYALESEWLIVRGGLSIEATSTSVAVDGSINEVARRIVASGHFEGELFSAGDEYIADCAVNRGSVGGASEWRKANMNHHLTRVVTDLTRLYAQPLIVRRARRVPIQTELAV